MKVLSNLDLTKNQILNVVLQNLSSDPGSPLEGLIYQNTTDKVPKIYTNATWKTFEFTGHLHTLASATFANQGTAAQVLHGNASGNPSWGAIVAGDITNATITYDKIQNVSATDKILGRASAGAGTIEEIACTSAGRALLDDVDAAAQRTTLGLGTMALETATNYILKSVYTANSVVYATTASTPVALTVPASTVVGRKATGDITALSSADALTVIGAAASGHNHDSVYIAKALGTTKGDLITFSASATPARLGVGTTGQVLTAQSDGTNAWQTMAAGHTQNTDTGTTNSTFSLDSDAASPILLKNNAGVLELKNSGDTAYMDMVVNNLTVKGTTTTVESETITFNDNIIMLDNNATTAAATAGLQVERGSTGTDASLLWVEATGMFAAGLAGSELKLARVVTANVGDGTNTSYDITHNLGTRDVQVQLVTTASPYDAVMTDWQAKSTTQVTLLFAAPPSSNQYRVIITG
jgi:hypothetical protein